MGKPEKLLDAASSVGKKVADTVRPIYMDIQATTPVDPRVLDKMLPFMTTKYGNPSSRNHLFGWEAERAVEKARAEVAALVGCKPSEVVFTGSATESINMAIKGLAKKYPDRKHIITTQIEHKAVLNSCRRLENEGYEVTYLPVSKDGVVDPEEVRKAIKKNTLLVSVMAVNNEVGSILPISEIGKICKEKNVFFHTDATQAIGKIPVDISNINLLSMSGHKIYGPKGVGALIIKRNPRVLIEPIIDGGGQERGMRSGTVSTAQAIGLGRAARLCIENRERDGKRIEDLRDRLMSRVPYTQRNGNGIPGCVNLSFEHVEGESLMMGLKNVALSSGSACTSASLEPSYVIKALGTDEELAHSSIRFGIGRFTMKKEIDAVADKCKQTVEKLREMSPLSEMVKQGVDLKKIEWTQH